MGQLGRIYLDILAPVFALVLIGYLVGPRLGLEARTLSRVAYYVFVPAFNFNVISTAKIAAAVAGRMILFITAVEIACAVAGFAAAKLLRRPSKVVAAYVLIAVFPNVGNFGLPIVQFAFGPEAITAAGIYFVAINVVSFVIGVAAANLQHGSNLRAVRAAFLTPGVLAVPPALLFNLAGIAPPLALARPVTLLAGAMIPVMLVALGVQLASAGIPRLDRDMLGASLVRLLGGPALAAVIAVPFGMAGLERNAGIVQAAMPTAVLASIIAFEHDLLPTFVTATVLFSTILSMLTLAIVLAVV